MAKKRALVLLAPGFEELEAVAVIDILRRAEVEVVAAGTVSDPIRSARGVVICPDASLDEVKDGPFDLVVLPGGMEGTENLSNDPRVKELLRRHLARGGAVGAICAAPTILDRHGLASEKTITCHPAVRSAVRDARLSDARVVRDGLLVTSQGPGTALEFALRLVELLFGTERMKEVNRGVLARLS